MWERQEHDMQVLATHDEKSYVFVARLLLLLVIIHYRNACALHVSIICMAPPYIQKAICLEIQLGGHPVTRHHL
jgi:hypothetical protein